MRRCPAAPGRAPARASRPRSDRRGERPQHRPMAVAGGPSIGSVSYRGPPASHRAAAGREELRRGRAARGGDDRNMESQEGLAGARERGRRTRSREVWPWRGEQRRAACAGLRTVIGRPRSLVQGLREDIVGTLRDAALYRRASRYPGVASMQSRTQRRNERNERYRTVGWRLSAPRRTWIPSSDIAETRGDARWGAEQALAHCRSNCRP